MKFKCAYTDLVETHKLVPNPKNPNKHPLKQIKMLSKIIDYQGQRSPIVISRRSGFIIKGHGRLEAIKLLKWKQCAVDYQDYENEAQEYADLEADNRIAELSKIDMDFSLTNIDDILDPDFDKELLGIEILEEKEISLPDLKQLEEYLIVVECKDENEMRDLYNEFEIREIKCKLIK